MHPVNEEEARQYAKDINALYKLVSAENGDGINEIFKMIGERMLTQEFLEKIKNEKNNNDNNSTNNNKNTIKNISIEDNKGQKKKKKCC